MAPARDDSPSSPASAPLTQRQEDVLLELFLQLSVDDRKKVIKFVRDLARRAQDSGKN